MNKVVFDTNVLVSAALFRQSVPRQAFEKAIRQGTVFSSTDCLAELSEVLHRPKFSKYLTPFEASLFIASFAQDTLLANVISIIAECRDPKDDKFLALAFDSNANCIVTGDPDLLVMNPWRGVSILTPAAFLLVSRRP